MLMVAIFNWDEELCFRPAKSIEWVKDLKNRVLPHCDFVLYDSNLLCPVKLDWAIHELSEDEVIEFLRGDAYSALEAEGKLKKHNGKYKRA